MCCSSWRRGMVNQIVVLGLEEEDEGFELQLQVVKAIWVKGFEYLQLFLCLLDHLPWWTFHYLLAPSLAVFEGEPLLRHGRDQRLAFLIRVWKLCLFNSSFRIVMLLFTVSQRECSRKWKRQFSDCALSVMMALALFWESKTWRHVPPGNSFSLVERMRNVILARGLLPIKR